MIACSCFVAVPLAAFLLISLSVVSRHYEDQIRFSASQAFDQAYSFTSTRMHALVKASDVVYFGTEVQTVFSRDRDKYERDIVQQNIDMMNLDRFLYDFRDNEDVYRVTLYVPGWFMFADQGSAFDNFDRFKRTALYGSIIRSTDKVMWTPKERVISDENSALSADVFSMYRKIRNKDSIQTIIGVMKISILAKNIADILEKADISKRGTVFIVDSSERLICKAADDGGLAERLAPAALFAAAEPGESHEWKRARVAGSDYEYKAKTLESSDWTLVSAVPLSEIRYSADQLKRMLLLLTATIAVAAFLVAAYFSSSATRRIVRLTEMMNTVRDRSLGAALPTGARDEIGQLIDSYNYMLERIHALIEAQYEAGRSVKSAELRALQAQINPHFLYNALDLINWKAIERGAPEIAEISRALARFYYISLSGGQAIVSLADELGNVEAYMQIQNLRFENRIRFIVDIPDALRLCSMPKLILQPLVENAIAHGIREKEPEPSGFISIKAVREGDAIVLTVEDDGVGIPEDKIATLLVEGGSSDRHGYGVRNVNERIRLTYGEGYGLSFARRPGGGTIVTVRIPVVGAT